MRRMGLIPFLAVAMAVSAAPAFAGAGIHLGATTSPDDFLVGLHFSSKPIAESLRLVPSVEAGFGDVTMVAGNLDVHYPFKTSSDLAPYIGAGFTVNWFDFEGNSETDFGGSVLGGLSLSSKWFFETKLGLGDVPDWKFYIGASMP
jgi:hypothetical protein